MSRPIAPYECRHVHELFIESGQGTPLGDDTLVPDRHHVLVCADCGQFRVFAEKSGKCVEVTFELPTAELVRAAGQYARRLAQEKQPIIVCLCGSTRFGDAFRKAQLEETLAGKIVLSIGCNMKSDTEIFGHLPEDELAAIKARLDELHLRKIDMADEVLVLNVGGYIGESTRRELEYAREHGRRIRYLELPKR